MLFLAIALMLWGFDVAPKVDAETGKPILLDPPKLVPGAIVHPVPFPAKITLTRHDDMITALLRIIAISFP